MSKTQGNFQTALDEYLRTAGSLPEWQKHVPDELYNSILNYSDFLDFLKFLSNSLGTDLIEYGTEDLINILENIVHYATEGATLSYMDEIGLRSDLGRLAYLFVLAVGNSD